MLRIINFYCVALFAVLFALALASPVAEANIRNPPPPGTCSVCTASPNNCDITAPCSNFLGKLYCGCRPGYRASPNIAPNDINKQWRLNYPGHEHRVWVKPGVACDKLCNAPFGTNVCGEVPFVAACLPK